MGALAKYLKSNSIQYASAVREVSASPERYFSIGLQSTGLEAIRCEQPRILSD